VRGTSTAWSLVNEVTEIKKGVAVITRIPTSKGEAEAFLAAVISERKDLEASLRLSLS